MIRMYVRALPIICIVALAQGVLGPHVYAADQTTPVPEPAAAVGFNTRTFGPNVTIGGNWQKYNFLGTKPAAINVTQNADGSVTINPGGNDYGASLCTASVGTGAGNFSGIAFGGGGYFQATMSFSGPASFWADDIESLNGVSVGAGPNPWPGQRAGYGNWIETDFGEFDSPNEYGFAIHNWYGIVGSGAGTSTLHSGSPVSPPGADYTRPNTYGFLWVPATPTHQGYARFYFNGVQVGNTIKWNQYDPSARPPPSEANGTAYSVLDKLHLALILGTGATTSNTVYDVQVWQASAANNTATPPTPTPAPRAPQRR